MGKVAFVFPGQGAQYSGMGRELAEASAAAAAVFAAADSLRPGTSRQCFSGDEAGLSQTRNTQPCMYAVEMAAAAALEEAGIHADMTAGFSLGELAALTYARGADFSTVFPLVCTRGEAMERAASQADTAMWAVAGLTGARVEEICAGFEGFYPVNYNCPGQTSVAGRKQATAEFSNGVKAAGGRAIPLKVSGGFHSPYMAPAAAAFAQALEGVDFREPAIPLYANCTGLPYEPARIKPLLTRQICSPVRWEATIRHMIAQGVDTFIEVGPGQVLQGLIAKINPALRRFGVCDRKSLEKTIQEVRGC